MRDYWPTCPIGTRQPVKVVNSGEAIDDYEKWHGLYKRLIVDRSQH